MSSSPRTTIETPPRNPDAIRNVCILAHVDHGKTSLSDHLLSANGHISARVAGQVRYLDSRQDEQERCITMKSSAIALTYRDHVVNVVDSPGHIDFSSEVSTATRLCDGALVLVDVVEGIQVQTHSVLRQAWDDGVRPVLVLNKLDRLILDLRMTPPEAYHRCRQVIEQANALVSSLHMADLMARASGADLDDDDDDDVVVFGPERGNVVFASAMDGWAFAVADAARFYARVLGMKAAALEKALWGDFYYSHKTKTVSKKATTAAAQPMFVQFVLNSLWQAYECLTATPVDPVKVDKLVQTLGVNVQRRDLQSRDGRARLQAVMRAWYPLAPAVLALCVAHLPSPTQAAPYRLRRIWPDGLTGESRLRQAAVTCRAGPDDPVLVAVAKMVAVTADQLNHRRTPAFERRPYRPAAQRQAEAAEPAPAVSQEEEPAADDVPRFVGLCRVFCGRLRPDADLYVYNESAADCVRLPGGTLRLYTFMGTDLEPISMAYAGQVVAIAGLDDVVLSAATLSSERHTPPFRLLRFASAPIVRVALEPVRTADLSALADGLRLLRHADPNIDVVQHQSGQIHLMTSGELHLERCLRDLNDRFAPGIALRVSPPVVPFRETVAAESAVVGHARDHAVTFGVRIRPLPAELIQRLDANGELDGVVAVRGRANVLAFGFAPDAVTDAVARAFIAGFQTAVSAGTLCEEPMQGVHVVIDHVDVAGDVDDGQVRAAVRSAIRAAFDAASPRLVEPVYKVQLQCRSAQLGNLCNVLAKRRGRTTRDDMIDGTDMFAVDAFVPVESSMGLAHDLRSRTSGSAAPQLLFSHWETIDIDPNWTPTTADELEEFGAGGTQKANFARDLVDRVRRRKGLAVHQHLVEFAEKQNTAKHS